MTRLTIVTLNESNHWQKHSALRQRCYPVNVDDGEDLSEAQIIIKEMFRTLYTDSSSVALAAPQVGILKQIIVISYEDRETANTLSLDRKS